MSDHSARQTGSVLPVNAHPPHLAVQLPGAVFAGYRQGGHWPPIMRWGAAPGRSWLPNRSAASTARDRPDNRPREDLMAEQWR